MQTAETSPRSDVIVTIGLTFVAALMVVVGVQHLHFATFVATLVPAWIPWRFFWACFVGGSFFAAARKLRQQNSSASRRNPSGRDVSDFCLDRAQSKNRDSF